FLLLAAIGLVMALRRRRLRFLALWLIAGCAAIETLEHIHPHWYVTRHFLPAGVVMPVLAALPLAWLVEGERRATRLASGALIVLVLLFDFRSLAVYFREGRPDWRVLARFLRQRPSTERIFTENQYSQICVSFYTAGPEFLYRRGRTVPQVYSLEREPIRL